jgi:hypothetical protein
LPDHNKIITTRLAVSRAKDFLWLLVIQKFCPLKLISVICPGIGLKIKLLIDCKSKINFFERPVLFHLNNIHLRNRREENYQEGGDNYQPILTGSGSNRQMAVFLTDTENYHGASFLCVILPTLLL